MAKKTAGRENFLIQILDVQNATWQGVLTWTETGRKEPFRSALELIKLIDSTLMDDTSDPTAG